MSYNCNNNHVSYLPLLYIPHSSQRKWSVVSQICSWLKLCMYLSLFQWQLIELSHAPFDFYPSPYTSNEMEWWTPFHLCLSCTFVCGQYFGQPHARLYKDTEYKDKWCILYWLGAYLLLWPCDKVYMYICTMTRASIDRKRRVMAGLFKYF